MMMKYLLTSLCLGKYFQYNSIRGCVPTVVAIALFKRTGPRMGIFRVKKSLKSIKSTI